MSTPPTHMKFAPVCSPVKLLNAPRVGKEGVVDLDLSVGLDVVQMREALFDLVAGF